MATIEFLYVSPTLDVETVHIGIFPPYGRYFRREMTRRGDNLFWFETDIDGGDVYYHFFLNGDFSRPVFHKMEDLASRRDPMKRSSKHVGTLPFCLLEFRESSAFLQVAGNGDIHIRAISHHNWVNDVHAVFPGRDPVPLRPVFTFKNRKYWDLRLPSDWGGRPFVFRLRGEGRERYVHRGGWVSPDMDMAALFQLPLPETAKWERNIPAGAVGYQIFPDRFCRYPETPDPSIAPWGSPPQNGVFCGGTLRGVIRRLDYLNQLGVDFIYLNPVFHAGTAHRYDTVDYFRVDPLLGTEADLAELTAGAHRRGMAVILDLALNHCGVEFFAFADVLAKGRDSRYRDWFHIFRFPVAAGDNRSYQCWQGDPSLPEFNLENPEVTDYLTRVACHWLERCAVDGFRLDTSTYLPMPFLAGLSAELRRIEPGITLVGEVWHGDVERLLDEGDLDGVTGYPLYWDVLAPLAEGIVAPSGALADALLHWLYHVPLRCLAASWNFLGNHDLPRICSIMKDRSHIEALLLLLHAVPGCPVLYYGDEAGLLGMDDPENRGCMDWQAVIGSTCVGLLRKLGEARQRWRHVFADPSLAVPIADRDSGVLGLLRSCGDESLLFLLHSGDEAVTVDLEACAGISMCEDVLNGERLTARATLAPFQNRMLYAGKQ